MQVHSQLVHFLLKDHVLAGHWVLLGLQLLPTHPSVDRGDRLAQDFRGFSHAVVIVFLAHLVHPFRRLSLRHLPLDSGVVANDEWVSHVALCRLHTGQRPFELCLLDFQIGRERSSDALWDDPGVRNDVGMVTGDKVGVG